MKRLQVVNPDLLVLLFRVVFKRAKTLQEVLESDARIQTIGGSPLCRRLDDEGQPDELLGYWCVKADRSDFSLEERVARVLEAFSSASSSSSQATAARILFSFASRHVDSLRPRRAEAGDGGVLSFENFATLYRIMQALPATFSAEELGALAEAFSSRERTYLLLEKEKQAQQSHGGANGLSESFQNHVDAAKADGLAAAAAGGLGGGSGVEDLGQGMALEKGTHSEEVEDKANKFFRMIYTGELVVTDMVSLLKRFKSSPDVTEQEVFRCMIHNLFDEYRFFHKYPDKELDVTGKLFGMLIQDQLVSSITLGVALRYVLEALRKDPAQGESLEKMFRFGKIALEQFVTRLGEWPQYCAHLVQFAHFKTHGPELFLEVQRAVGLPTTSQVTPAPGGVGGRVGGTGASDDVLAATSNLNSAANGLDMAMASLSIAGAKAGGAAGSDVGAAAGGGALMNGAASASITALVAGGGNAAKRRDSEEHPSRLNGKMSVLETMVAVNVETASMSELPPETVRDQIHFIINNIAKSNYDAKCAELKALLTPAHFAWFANYLVVKRISTQPNLQPMYMSVLDSFHSSELYKCVLDSTYHNVTKYLQSPNITSSSSERSLLRNLGVWLGQITLAKNRPLLQRRINLKELLFWGFETGRLIAVCSFVARIVEGVKESKVFRPPNPWLMALLGVMRDLYEESDLKMNIKFEVQVLCKNVNIRIEDIPKANSLGSLRMPIKDGRNPDFNMPKNSVGSTSPVGPGIPLPSPPLPSLTPELGAGPGIAGGGGIGAGASDAAAAAEQTLIPNLAAHITINASLAFFVANPSQRRFVALAVDRAIREVAQPIVERAVNVACITTKGVVLKDFATEPNEQQLRNGAQPMVSHLAGSLAIVSCKDPLRASIGNHLRNFLAPSQAQGLLDSDTLDQILQVCTADNLDLGCALIEKAAMEKAAQSIDEVLASSYLDRRKTREAGQQFVDITALTATGGDAPSRYPHALPDALKPRLGGLLNAQLQVYDGFQRQRTQAAAAAAAQAQAQQYMNEGSPLQSGMAAPSGIADIKSLPPPASAATLLAAVGGGAAGAAGGLPALKMNQALEAYQTIISRIDMSLKAVQVQAQGRDVTILMLGADHEILTLLRELVMVTQRTAANVRIEAAMAFAENMFRRTVEAVAIPDILRVEVMVGCLETLREACGGAKNFSPDISTWLNHYGAFNVADDMSRKMHRAVLLLLLRGKLISSATVDQYFAVNMDGGRNMLWVELALSFVRQCLADSLAATYEFTNTFDTVSKMRPANATVRKQLQKWLTDLRTLAASKDEQQAGKPGGAGGVAGGPNQHSNDAAVREHVKELLEKWLRVWNSINDVVFRQYLQLMHQYGVLMTEEAADRFFRVATELCVDACLKSAQQQQPGGVGIDALSTTLNYTVVNALSKLFSLLVRLADKEATDANVKVNLLTRILSAISRTLIDDHEAKKSNKLMFDQRPHYRLLSNLNQELGTIADPKSNTEIDPSMMPLLSAYSHIFLAISPTVVPGFAYGWLQLISCRSFMPQLLLVKGQKGWPYMHRLLISLLTFLQPFLKHAQLNDAVRKLYKGTLRIMLVILHDFPEFLCDYHLSFCDVIPATCVQLRNLVLSAYPRSMRLTDPFTPNLKVDMLPEISQPPRMTSDYLLVLANIRQRLDAFLETKQPPGVPALIPAVLMVGGADHEIYNVALINALIVHLGTQGAVQISQGKATLPVSASMDIFRHLVTALDAEGIFHMISAMANQLRYPNYLTHYFSCVLLYLFLESKTEHVQEIITRVLLERLIALRPHPWGLLITFIELIRNPRYAFWKRSFTRCAPEIEKVFESVARSCIGPTAQGAVTSSASINPRSG